MSVFPPKPDRIEGFDKPVSWLVGRDLLAGLKWIALYTAFKGKLDPRDWMTGNAFPEKKTEDECLNFWRKRNDKNWLWKVEHDKYWQELNHRTPRFWQETSAEEFWFDYIADSGDGQMGVYGVAYLCMSDLWAGDSTPVGSSVSFEETSEQPQLLPRGQFLFVGGDTAYHIADYTGLHTRFQQPFRWAFTSIRNWLADQDRLIIELTDKEGHIVEPKQGQLVQSDSEPARPIFGIPGNHDYYDAVDGFNRQFRQPAVQEHTRERTRPQLSLPGFERQQLASYVALHLPFGWWLWGLDTEVSNLDVRQKNFFLKPGDRSPDKLILATPEPTTVFRERKPDTDKTLEAYSQLGLTQPYLPTDNEPAGRCRLDLSGDVHHYARYFGPNVKDHLRGRADRSSMNYASVVSGGGGAFMHPSQTRLSGEDAVEEQVLYPRADISQSVFAKPLFDLRNIFGGGYVWLFGMILAGIIYFALTVPETSKAFLEWVILGCDNCLGRKFFGYQIPFTKDSRFPGLPDSHFSRVISMKGFIPWTILLIAAIAVLGAAIYLFYTYIKCLTNAPVIFDEDITDQKENQDESENRALTVAQTNNEPKPNRTRTKYRDLLPVGWRVAGALVLYVVGIIKFVISAKLLHPFGASLLVLGHIIIAAEFIVLSTQNSAWLANRTKFEAGTKHRYLPVWILTVLGGCFAFFGVWIFGSYPGAYLLSDTIFALVVVGLLLTLTMLGATMGGELQRRPGKVFMGIIGFWHAILQLTVPLLLVRFGDWHAVIAALILILIFSGVSIPLTRISILGLGARLMKLREPWNQLTLTLFWFVYGALLLWLPLHWHKRAVLHTSNGQYSSFLPAVAVTWLQAHLSFKWYTPAVALLIISLLTALLFGFLLSMSFLSWYFAVALAFQGHNNEVGGAGRIEKFRHIMRVRLTKDDVTAYVIAFDDPAVDGHNLEPKLVDVFRLHVT